MDMIQVIGNDIGFNLTGRIYVYDTDPVGPPSENPHGYDITFTSFSAG